MNAPTLIIGLGGTGAKIVERVSNMVTSEQRNNIAFVAFDTDINELRVIQQRNPFIKIIQTSTKQTVGEYLEKDKHARDAWFPVNPTLNTKTMTEGAGQVRSISRLAFESAVRAGKMEPLHEAIQSLYRVEEDKVEQALRIVIVSSLAGGTGSGLLLPVALYTKNYLKTHFKQSANICRGFFILPEVFYEVIKNTGERNNLKVNAYATLRELDAFLMKGDKDPALMDKYGDSVHIQFPVVGSDGYEEYDVRPYDYCFLFDAQNAEGAKLSSFDQYLDHAANCIYAQSIGPMNKRSNSSEDNTIREIAKAHGRNRYAGAGVSMLIYPFEDIKTLIALKWAKQGVSKQWLKYDNRFKELKQENAEKIEKGIGFVEQSRSTFYVNQVKSDEEHEDAFAKAMVKATGFYHNGITRKGDNWVAYVGAVMRKADEDLKNSSSSISNQYENAKGQVDSLEKYKEWKKYAEAYEAIEEYRLAANANATEVAQTIAYAMFKGTKVGSTSEIQDYNLEKYLKDNGKFIHPNAVRYMLIETLELMKKHKMTEDEKQKNLKQKIETFEEKTFDDPNTDEKVEDVNDLKDNKMYKGGFFEEKLSKKPTSAQEELRSKFKNHLGNIVHYQECLVKSVVLAEGISYIESLIKAFESFYDSFDSKIEMIDSSIEEIYKKYGNTKGSTVRYVCASKECLDKICESKPYLGSAVAIDSELAQSIYAKVYDYAMRKEKPNSNRYFNDLFDNEIMGYFENAVMDACGDSIDVDIISAIENEADLIGGFEEEDDAYSLIDQYVRKVLNDTRRLSCPFIETPNNQSKESRPACTFSKDLKPKKGDESSRAKLVNAELMNYGGEPDEDISKYMIMFYQSYYGLRATDLSKFAPPSNSKTYDRPCGEYFKAYYDMTVNIHPQADKSDEINPHIDKWWHIATKMPDLDDDNQRKQEKEAYAAFFWAMVKEYIYLEGDGSDTRVYKLRNISLDMNSDVLTVSNGTECDKLYEALDAVAIYPELIKKILNYIELLKQEDINESGKLEDGILMAGLKTFSVEEPGVGPDSKPCSSIFDLPMLLKKSATPDIYHEDDVIELLKTELEEIKKYISNFCSKKDLPEVFTNIVIEQFDKHLETLACESEVNPGIYKESLFMKVCDTIAKALSDVRMLKEAAYVDGMRSKLRK